MSDFVNPHQPEHEGGLLKCQAPDCGYWRTFYVPEYRDYAEWLASACEGFKREHSEQFKPGRAPDISVDWEISACCSVCEDGIGDVVSEDSESLRCKECSTTWSMEGDSGERDDED